MGVTDDFANVNVDWDEIFEYQPGFVVEVLSHPGVYDTIRQYEPMMVPPIWLVNDPRPRYPHELRIVSKTKTGSVLVNVIVYKTVLLLKEKLRIALTR
jgi:hypothetical protein